MVRTNREEDGKAGRNGPESGHRNLLGVSARRFDARDEQRGEGRPGDQVS